MNLAPSDRDLTTVADWLDGRLTAGAAAELAAREPVDPGLRADAAFVRQVRAAGRSLPLVEPPELVRQKLHQQCRRRADPQPKRLAAVLELVGTLVFDSRRQQLPLATRRLPGGRSAHDVVHLVWHTDLAELVLEVRHDAESHVRLDGQVLLEQESASGVFEAEVTGPSTSVSAVDGDEFGRFSLRAPRDVSVLRVSNGELSLQVDLHLEPDEGGPP